MKQRTHFFIKSNIYCHACMYSVQIARKIAVILFNVVRNLVVVQTVVASEIVQILVRILLTIIKLSCETTII